MALLDDIATRLVADGVGTLATTLFLGYLPDSPDAVVAVYETRGTAPQHTFGAGVMAVERPVIRVYCRAARNDYPAARAKAVAVLNSLGAIRNTTIGSTKFLSVEATSSPYPIGGDDKERARFGIDFAVWVLP